MTPAGGYMFDRLATEYDERDSVSGVFYDALLDAMEDLADELDRTEATLA